MEIKSNRQLYKLKLNRRVNIDYLIEKEIISTITKVKNTFESEKVDIISKEEKDKIVQEIEGIQEKIKVIFKKGFSETEEKIENRIKNNNRVVDNKNIVSKLIASQIEKALEELESKNRYDGEFISYILDRKVFIVKVIKEGILDEESISDILTIDNKEEQR